MTPTETTAPARKKPKKGVNWVVLAVGAALILPTLWLFATSFGNDPHALPSVLVRQPAPAFALADLQGTRWSLDGQKGTPTVLNFWSTWCGPCKAEHAVLQEAARRHAGKVQFLGVIYQDDPDACGRYLDKVGTSYPHLVDDAGRVAIDYGVAGVPETFFIGADGTILHKQVGPVNAAMIEALLARLERGE